MGRQAPFVGSRDGRGSPVAVCTCQKCGVQDIIRCDFDKRSSDAKRHGGEHPAPLTSQAVKKITAKGWTYVSKELLCPTCSPQRAFSTITEPEAEPMNKSTNKARLSDLGAVLQAVAVNAKPDPLPVDTQIAAKLSPSETPLRAPSKEQRRQIYELLLDVYDTVLERYRDGETDKTVAEAVGGGCMPGWVTEIRERDFGPSGENDEMDVLRADILAWMDRQRTMENNLQRLDAEAKEAHGQLEKARKEVTELQHRLAAICRNVGPKAKA